jgi:hypothetical protein
MNIRLTSESTMVPTLDVCGSTGAPNGEGKSVNGELEPCSALGRFAWVSEGGV